MERRSVGVAVIGSGRIGSLRARLSAEHAGVSALVVADVVADRARRLAQDVGADDWTTEVLDVIDDDRVDAVVVSTPEGEHVAAVVRALSAGKDVLVEKPIALTLADADTIIDAAVKSGGSLRVGYSRRFRRRYHTLKEQIVQGRLGGLVGGTARVYNSRSQAFAILDRNPHATPIVDALTYYVDLMNWFLEGQHPLDVHAVGSRGVLADAGRDVDDLTWAIVRYSGGAVVQFGVCYSLPAGFPVLGHAARVEMIGTDGVVLIDDDHTDQIMHSLHGNPHVYLPDHTVDTVFLSSGTPGDWALGGFIGPLASETRAWLDHLTVGSTCHLATPEIARMTLATTLAIEEASATGQRIAVDRRSGAG